MRRIGGPVCLVVWELRNRVRRMYFDALLAREAAARREQAAEVRENDAALREDRALAAEAAAAEAERRLHRCVLEERAELDEAFMRGWAKGFGDGIRMGGGGED